MIVVYCGLRLYVLTKTMNRISLVVNHVWIKKSIFDFKYIDLNLNAF